MRARTLCTLLVTATVGLAACGGGDDETARAGTPAASQEASVPGDTVAVKSADSPLGDILVGPNGLTLYGFTNDADGQSSCSGTCAEAWPPLLVDDDWTVGPGLDNAVFNTVTREDGSHQLVAGRWPLYYFSGDTAPGDVNGQGSGGVWFAVALDTTLVQDGAAGAGGGEAGAATVQVAETDLGEVLVDGEGLTLYAFTHDEEGMPTCTGNCAETWPALLVEGEPTVGEGLDQATFTTVDGAEGGTQVVAGRWPLYRFSGDAAPGDVNGQGSGGVWFAVRPDGTLADG